MKKVKNKLLNVRRTAGRDRRHFYQLFRVALSLPLTGGLHDTGGEFQVR